MSDKKRKYLKTGRPRKYDYRGDKKITSIRLTHGERTQILMEYKSVQEFIQDAIKKLLGKGD